MDNIETNNEAAINTVKKKNIKPILIILAILAIAVIAIAIIANAGKTVLSADELCILNYSGTDGKGKADVQINFSEINALAGDEESFNSSIIYLEDSFEAEVTPNEGLSNGDEVTITLSYDEKLAKKFRLKIKPRAYTSTVVGLPVADDLNPFDSLSVSYTGSSPYATIVIDKNDSPDFVRQYVNFKADKDSGLKNGDKVTITAEYNPSVAESSLVNITQEQKEYTVSDLSEYLQADSEADLSSLESALSDKALAVISKAKSDGSIFGMAFFADTTFDVSSHYSYQDLKITDRLLCSVKDSSGYVSEYNALYTMYQVTAQEQNGNSTTLYFWVKAKNIVKQADGSLSWDSNLNVTATTNSTGLMNSINSSKDSYSFTEFDFSKAVIPAI
jgi:hypothetical protein